MATKVHLGSEEDNCGGLLKVKNRNNRWITIARGVWKLVEVAPDGDGYWYWRCGSEIERSRGQANFRQRVKMLDVFHSEESRRIFWKCYDVM